MKQTIRLTESEFKQYIKKLIIEAGPYSGKDDYVKAGPFHTDTYHNDKLHYKYLLRIIKDIDNYFAISNFDEYKIGGWGNREGGIGSDEYKISHILQNTMDELSKYVKRMPKETLNNRLSDEQENQDYKQSKGRFTYKGYKDDPTFGGPGNYDSMYGSKD